MEKYQKTGAKEGTKTKRTTTPELKETQMVATLFCPVGEGRKSLTCNIAVYRDMDSINDCLINLPPWIRHHALEMVSKV